MKQSKSLWAAKLKIKMSNIMADKAKKNRGK